MSDKIFTSFIFYGQIKTPTTYLDYSAKKSYSRRFERQKISSQRKATVSLWNMQHLGKFPIIFKLPTSFAHSTCDILRSKGSLCLSDYGLKDSPIRLVSFRLHSHG